MGGSSIMASAGRVLPLPKGAYSPSTTYHLLDFVSYQGSTYICKQTSTGNAPTNTTYWQIMAQGTESASVAGNYYGTCSTGASTSAKIVSIPATENFVLQVGDIIGIKFDNTNTANNPSLNVNNSGAKPIYYNNSAVSTSNLWASGEANRVTIFMYDGTNWIWMGHDVDIDTDTLSDLKDTTISSASNGQVLMYDSTSNKWKNQTPIKTLAGLSDTQISSATDGQVLKYNSTSQKWVNGEDKGGILPHLIVISETGESVVKAVKGTTEIIATEKSTGHYECDVPEFGTWTIHAVLNGDDATVNLVVDTVKVYTVDDSHFHADITVTYPSGATCSCSKTGETTLYANTNPYTFTVHSSGTWTITVVDNGITYTETVNVTTSGQTFTKKIPTPSQAPANDINYWLWFGGVNGTFSSLGEILANSTALSILMASTDAVDYLVRCKRWVGNLVPIMTSNTTPNGTCFGSTTASSPTYDYFKVFDRNKTTFWNSAANESISWLGYHFSEAIIVNRVHLTAHSTYKFGYSSFKVQGSNDGTNYTDLTEALTWNDVVNNSQDYIFYNTAAYSYYRIYATGTANQHMLAELQFYGNATSVTENQTAMSYIGLNNYCADTLLADNDWEREIVSSEYFGNVLNAEVPTMTSNTTPRGVASTDGAYSADYAAWKAFSGGNASSSNKGYCPLNQRGWLQYEFEKPVSVKKVYYQGSDYGTGVSAVIKASLDGTTFTDVENIPNPSAATSAGDTLNILGKGVTKYKYWRVANLLQNGSGYKFQFYGREDV